MDKDFERDCHTLMNQLDGGQMDKGLARRVVQRGTVLADSLEGAACEQLLKTVEVIRSILLDVEENPSRYKHV